MMPDKKSYSYTNMGDAPLHGEIIESSYLLKEKEPKSTLTRVLEVVLLVAGICGCAYLMIFLFRSGNHKSHERGSHPHTPVRAASMSSEDPSCQNYPACVDLTGSCCPNIEGDTLACCLE